MPIIGVPNPADGDDKDKQAFIDLMSSPIPHVLDDPGALWDEFDISSQPAMVFVHGDGTWERRTGALGNTALLERVKEMAAA